MILYRACTWLLRKKEIFDAKLANKGFPFSVKPPSYRKVKSYGSSDI